MQSDATAQRFAGKAALVTGGGSGIGLGCARRLAFEGASVTICGRTGQCIGVDGGHSLRRGPDLTGLVGSFFDEALTARLSPQKSL